VRSLWGPRVKRGSHPPARLVTLNPSAAVYRDPWGRLAARGGQVWTTVMRASYAVSWASDGGLGCPIITFFFR
jgi:hypothetical protein